MVQELVKAYGYMRVSGKSQVEGDGFPRQQLAIAAYAEANGLDVVRSFREEGIAGTCEWDDRPAFLEMRALMVANGVKAVIVERLDRLARDLMVQEAIIKDFRLHGISLISTAEPDLCSNDPSRKFMRQVLGAAAEYEKALIVNKLRAARGRAKAATGRCEGAKPYGFRENEKDVLALLLRWHGENVGATEMARRLNDAGVKPRRGDKWHHYTISRILDKQEKEIYGGS